MSVKNTHVFIGGSQDGQRHPMPNSEVEVKRLVRMEAQNMQALLESAPTASPAKVDYTDEVYTRRALYTGDGHMLTYFAPENMSDHDALCHLFKRHRP